MPKHQFSSLAKKHDGARCSDAMSRWTQFIAMSTAQLSGSIKRTTLARANQDLSFRFYDALFGKLYVRC